MNAYFLSIPTCIGFLNNKKTNPHGVAKGYGLFYTPVVENRTHKHIDKIGYNIRDTVLNKRYVYYIVV